MVAGGPLSTRALTAPTGTPRRLPLPRLPPRRPKSCAAHTLPIGMVGGCRPILYSDGAKER